MVRSFGTMHPLQRFMGGLPTTMRQFWPRMFRRQALGCVRRAAEHGTRAARAPRRGALVDLAIGRNVFVFDLELAGGVDGDEGEAVVPVVHGAIIGVQIA